MTQSDHLRADFLTRLDDAMRTLPHGVASEIRAGIVEELAGLDAAATAARIEQLGDPLDIAREAQDEVPATPVIVVAPPVAPAPRPPVADTRGFAIAAALTLSFGGFVLPFVGWMIGAALVCISTLWRTWEKLVAILAPLVVGGLSVLVATMMWGFTTGADSGSSSGAGGFEAPGTNPLVPSLYDWHLLLLIGMLLIPASGLWLLWRLRGRTKR